MMAPTRFIAPQDTGRPIGNSLLSNIALTFCDAIEPIESMLVCEHDIGLTSFAIHHAMFDVSSN
jgi:hypothetical protein